MFCNSTITDLFLFVFTQLILHYQQISRETRKLRKSYYKLLFDYALKVGYIEVNPVNQVILPKSRVTLEEINRKKN